ncbi:MAG: hypothetical protein WA374_19250, partial [Acidobacteriaceae bacterium]
MRCRVVRRLAAIAIVVLSGAAAVAQEALPASMEISSGWQLQDVAKVPQAGATVSAKDYQPQGWLAATVPGTVLTSMVNDGVY